MRLVGDKWEEEESEEEGGKEKVEAQGSRLKAQGLEKQREVEVAFAESAGGRLSGRREG